jgi:integrase
MLEKHLNVVMPLVDQGAGRPDKKMAVRGLLTDWLAAKASEGIRPSTLGMYQNVVDGWLVPHIGALRLEQLNAASAGHLVETLRSPAGSSLGRGALSPRSIQLAIQCLKASTRWAFETGLFARDPLAGFKRPKAQESAAATAAWTTEEASRFLSSVAGDRLRAAWWILRGRGLRRGEGAGLKWNFDLETGVIRAVETRVVVSAKATASTPKTAAGRRAIPLDDRLVSELKSHKARQARERLAAGRPGISRTTCSWTSWATHIGPRR